MDMSKKTIFILGGCRSGKSRHALDLAHEMGAREKVFIATCVPRDDEMQQRVSSHQQERGPDWKTVEAPIHLPQAVIENSRSDNLVLADCLTLWISNLMLTADGNQQDMDNEIQKLIEALNTAAGPVLLVSNEVGTGIVPENKLARQYRDIVGSVNQAVAECADEVKWVVAGIPVTIKGKT